MKKYGKFCKIIFFVVLSFEFSHAQSSLSNYRSNVEHNVDDIYNSDKKHESLICMAMDLQRSLDMEQIMGKWYGNEIIIHTQDVPGVFTYDSCVIIHISDVTDQMQSQYYTNDYRRKSVIQTQQQQQNQRNEHRSSYPQQDLESPQLQTRYLRLVWSERDDTLEYIFNYTTDSLGRWTNVGEQHGSFVALNHYTQFKGTVQVAKAVNDHLVLTFCGSELKSSIYTIVLSRNPHGLSSQEIYRIRSMLSKRNLAVDTVRKICASSAAAVKASIFTFVFIALLTVFQKH